MKRSERKSSTFKANVKKLAVTGKIDLAAGGERICRMENCHSWMAKITGCGVCRTGC